MKRSYKVFVNDAAGWAQECPDYRTVFFGDHPGYVHPVEGGMEPVGHLLVVGYAHAVAIRNELNRSGDWTPAEGSDSTHPVYSLRREFRPSRFR